MRRTKILIVNLASIPESLGGTEYYSFNLAQALLQRGYDVSLLCALDSMQLKRYHIQSKEFGGVPIIQIANPLLQARSFNEHFVDANIDEIFRDIVAEQKPDLIHFQHLAYLSGRLPEIAHQMNTPSILTLHDYWYICFRSRLLRPGSGICTGPSGGTYCASCNDRSEHNPMAVTKYPLLLKMIGSPAVRTAIAQSMHWVPQAIIDRTRNHLFRSPDNNGKTTAETTHLLEDNLFRYDFFRKQLQYPRYLLSPSNYLKHKYEAEGLRNIEFLPLGYAQAEKVEGPSFAGQLKIAFIGSIERHKGLHVVLKELLALQSPSRVQFNVHGRAKDPLYFAEMKRFARKLPEGMVEFHGEYRSDRDLKMIFTQNHFLVFPSIWEENAPLVVREALLHGVPVIGSKLGGVPEVVDDGVNGLLFDPYKYGSLLSRLQLILDNPDVLFRITVGARITEIESMEEHVRKISVIYERALRP